MINGYLHIAAMGTPAIYSILGEITGRLLESGLYGKTNSIHVGIVGDAKQAEELYELILKVYPKFVIRYYSQNLGEFEWATLRWLREDALANYEGYVWYAHTKGVSQMGNPSVHPLIQRNATWWRNVMCHDIFTKHLEAIRLLDDGDVAAGPLFISGPDRYPQDDFGGVVSDIPRHFSGNFWWSKYSYIKTLPVPDMTSRQEAEFWIGRGEGSLGSLSVNKETPDYYGFSPMNPVPLEKFPWHN